MWKSFFSSKYSAIFANCKVEIAIFDFRNDHANDKTTT